ncbi:MMS19 nucleotide excision repair protein-like protein [Diplodia seriata]|uniref:MMS19 nucleotide excision repair protein n=1 Tax=Diplodia seriata TaxID=420778 RepID=A0A1S8BID1_9PEZI|nr:MMS19 nucleotide excision repair protein-like protein [Diplodia seriata]
MELAVLEDIPPRVRLTINSQISLVANKFIPSAEIKDIVNSIFFEPQQLLSTEKLEDKNIRVIFAIIKGLALRNAPVLNTVLPSLLELLKDSKHGLAVARGFSIILAPHDLLTKDNYCMVSGLHKQKVFNLLVPAIASSFKTADPSTKTNYLIGLSGILRWIPYTIMEPELSQLTPLLLQCLDLQQSQAPQGQQQQFDDVKKATVDTLIAVLTHEPKALEEHAASLITRLLSTASAASAKTKAAAATPTNSPALRAAALKCLALIPERLRGEIVLPFKRQVVKKLTAALDDSKRAVRLEAVKCRAAWLGMDEVDDDDE